MVQGFDFMIADVSVSIVQTNSFSKNFAGAAIAIWTSDDLLSLMSIIGYHKVAENEN